MHGHVKPSPRRSSGHLRFTSNVLRTLGVVNDAACFLGAYLLAAGAYAASIGYYYDSRLHHSGAIILCINFLLIRISRDGYVAFRGQGKDVGGSAIADFVLAAALTGLVVVQLDMLDEFSRGLALYFMGFTIVLLFLSRIGFRMLVSRLMNEGLIGQRVAVYAESAKVAQRVSQLLELERLPHLRLAGYADERTRGERSEIDLAYLGDLDDLLELARTGRLDQVIMAVPRISQARLDQISETLSAASIDLCVLPRETLELTTSYRVNFLGSLPVFAIWQQPIRDIDGILKEMIDYTVAIIAIVLLAPLLILTALAIRLESKGPILFRQARFGFNNNEISVLKFRSMYVDRQDQSGAQRTQKNDPRVTRVGRFIRRTSIDELPQLFNVLKGEMSIVGPRPHATMMRVGDKYYFDAVSGYSARHRVKPGITGLAQVRGLRGEIDTAERARKRVEYDIYYIENWSPLLDIRIILETVFKVFWDKHAY
ncbi:undecaprenyl-phosphate glucose phosphotransferase [Erythrobacter sp. sf7]|uniref:Undecaprenyl-phosphate glucose phosphotransferase n=1 Tax=Erythrobacter fulvus TaxID=2987523 RepID=A0ABT5JNC8_9SPHN|nr:undecaprenyl-phosphate glucose phosphotransferase [Erythrobacter fulvus]MDC8753611.1 undecaprenyl-phosphate glucose phosphotransferase [Erythrobacter fulvus]